jgi:hypothetical protein
MLWVAGRNVQVTHNDFGYVGRAVKTHELVQVIELRIQCANAVGRCDVLHVGEEHVERRGPRRWLKSRVKDPLVGETVRSVTIAIDDVTCEQDGVPTEQEKAAIRLEISLVWAFPEMGIGTNSRSPSENISHRPTTSGCSAAIRAAISATDPFRSVPR